MNFNHRIGERVTRYLVGRDYDVADMQCAKVCYAVESILGDVQKDIILFVLFSVTGLFQEFLFCFLTVNLVRRFLGGIHMKTNVGCTLVSVSVYLIAVTAGMFIPLVGIIVWGIILLTVYLMIRVAPLPAPNRPVYRGKRKRKIQIRGLTGLGILSICTAIYPFCSAFIAWTLILQIVEVGVVLLKEDYRNREIIEVPASISGDAEKLFMEYTRNYEQRVNGLIRFPAQFCSMSRKERTSAFKGFTDQEKDTLMAVMTDKQRERLVQDIHYQAVHDFWKKK